MAPQDGTDGAGNEPNLELPSFFGRRRKKSASAAQETPQETPPQPTADAEEPTRALRPTSAAKRLPPTPPPLRPTAAAKRPPPTPPPAPAAPEPEPVERARSRRGPEMSYDTDTRSDDATAVVLTEPVPAQADDAVEDESGRPRRRRPSRPKRPAVRRPSMPTVAARPAAIVTGVAVALTGSVLLWLILQGCTAVRGVSSCGGFGLVGITVTLVAQVLVGIVLLTALRVAEPRSTAVLGVGLAAAVAMVLFYAATPALATVIVLLVLTPVAFVVAAGVTTAVVEVDPGSR